MATYLIGDIQGCYDPLQRLLDAIAFDPSCDRLWPCGDLVNRGGKSLKVLRFLHSVAPSVEVTLGNHDLHLLAAQSKYPAGNSGNKELNKIIRADDANELIHWLSRQPLASYSKQHNVLRVHAGVIPQWDLQTTLERSAEIEQVLQSGKRRQYLRKMYGKRPKRWSDSLQGWKRLRVITNILTQIRFCKADGTLDLQTSGPPSKGKRKFKPWFKHKDRATRDVRIAFGHWAALGYRARKTYLALDSACVWGGVLTAYRLEDDQLFQVPKKAPKLRP